MPQQMIWFFVSIVFSLVAWGIVSARYIWPELRLRPRAQALQPLVVLHSFRFIGLAFLVPGVVSPDLPSALAHSAAYGDIIAAILALFSLLLLPSAAGVADAWIFNIWGFGDILTHGLAGRRLLPQQPEPAMQDSRHPAYGPATLAGCCCDGSKAPLWQYCQVGKYVQPYE